MMSQRQVETQAIERLIKLVERCEQARYAPFTAMEVQSDFGEAEEVITMINNTKRWGRAYFIIG